MAERRKSSLWRLGSVTWAVICTLVCMVASSTYAYFIFSGYESIVLQKAMVSALILPIFVGAPIYYFIARRMRALAFRNLRLQAEGARDGLTHCLNQTAFRTSVEGFLQPLRHQTSTRGALLVIDADHFKRINDSLGHENGDQALKLIAERVRSVVRRRDFVGRIGGEEFGVLLHHADLKIAASVAERIRKAVDLADFVADGGIHRLSVSVGGIVFEQSTSFSTLFRQADDLLYAAKENGRNRVEIAALPVVEPALAA